MQSKYINVNIFVYCPVCYFAEFITVIHLTVISFGFHVFKIISRPFLRTVGLFQCFIGLILCFGTLY